MENNAITIFTNTEFGNVRTHTDKNGTPWFVARDVATILGYHNTKKAIIDHVDDDEKMDGVTIRDTMGRPQRPVFINESGGSRLSSVRSFLKPSVSSVGLPLRFFPQSASMAVTWLSVMTNRLMTSSLVPWLMPSGLSTRERICRRSSANRYELVRIAQTKNVRCRNKRGGTTRLNPQRAFTKTSLKFMFEFELFFVELTFMSNF